MLREQGTPSDVGTADATVSPSWWPSSPHGAGGDHPHDAIGGGGARAAPRGVGEPQDPARRAPEPDPVAWLIALATFAAYTTLSVASTCAWTRDRGIWASTPSTCGSSPICMHPWSPSGGPASTCWATSFQPIVALVAPFFRLFPTPVTLLVAQALLTAVSVVPVCRAARALLGTGVSR